MITIILTLMLFSSCGPKEILKPEVQFTGGSQAWIDTPLGGSQLPLAAVEIIAHATSPDGIDSFELQINGETLANIKPDPNSIDQTLMYMHHLWQPPASGSYLIEVKAYDRNNQAGPPTHVVVVISSKETDMPTAAFSKLICSTPQEAVVSGSNVNISGRLTPSSGSEKIEIKIASPDGKTSIHELKISADGSFENNFVAEEIGKWTVQVFWEGTDQNPPTQSDPCYFEVKSGKPEFTLNHNINCRLGPGTYYDVVTSGKIGDVIPIEARSPDALWLYGIMNGSRCWMSLELGELNVNPWTLSERQPPPKPIKPTEAPLRCSNFKTKPDCLRHKDECKWIDSTLGPGICKPR